MRPFLPFVARDVAIAAATLALAGWDASLRASDESGALAWIVGGACGALVTVVAFLAHEWGHWLGAALSGGRVERPRRIASPFLFAFDTARSTRAQFLWMSAGGYAASAIAVVLILAWADLATTSGVVALALTSLGVLVTAILEIPTTLRVARGAPLPGGGVYTGSSAAPE